MVLNMPSLGPVLRARVLARVALTASLRLVPDSVSAALRERNHVHPTTLTAIAARVLRHRSIEGLGTFTLFDDTDVTLAAVDNQIARRLYWFGQDGYEPGEMVAWKVACGQARRIVEIGANIGYYTVQGARAAPGIPYRSVEAHPATVQILRRNVELNRLPDVEVVHAAAVSDPRVRSLQLALPDQERYVAPTGAFLATGTEGVGERRPASSTVTVPARDARSLIVGADLVKLDIEGAEHLVLDGALDVLLSNRAVLFVEVLRSTPRLREQLGHLLDAGFEAHVLSGRGLQRLRADELPTVDLTTQYGCRDLVVGPPDRLGEIASS